MSVKYSPLCDTDRSAYLSYLVLSRVGQVAPAEVEGLLQQVKDGLKEFDESGGVAGVVVGGVGCGSVVGGVGGADVSGGARAASGVVGVKGARNGGFHGGASSGVSVAAGVARSVGSWRRDGVVADEGVGSGAGEVGVSSVPGVTTASGPGGSPFVADGSAFSAHGSAPRVARGMVGAAARVGGIANDKRVIPDGMLKSHARGSTATFSTGHVDLFGKQKGDVFVKGATGPLVADVGSRFKTRADSRFLSFDVNGFDTGVLWRDSLAQMQGMLALISGEFQTVSTALLNGEGYTPGVVDLARAFGIFAHAQRDLVEANSYATMDAGRRAAFDLKMASTLMDMRGVYRSCCGRRRGGGVEYQSSTYEAMSAAASRMAESLSGNTRSVDQKPDAQIGKGSAASSLRGVCEFVRSDVSVEGFSRGRGKAAKGADENAAVSKILEDRKKEVQLEEARKKKKDEDLQSLLRIGAKSPMDCGCWRIGCPVCSSIGRASVSAAVKAAAGEDKRVLRLRNDLAVAKSELESMRRLYEAEKAEKEEYKRDALQNCGYD